MAQDQNTDESSARADSEPDWGVEQGDGSAGTGSAVPAPASADASAGWVFPFPRTVVALHRRLQSEYTGAGREQPLDPFKVSALLFEIQSIAYVADRRADAAALAACLMAACLRLRLSPVGNRRLGFALAMLFLRLNGIEFKARAEEKYTFAARFGYPGFGSNVFADWIRLSLIAQRTGAGTVVRVRTRGRRIEGLAMVRTSKAGRGDAARAAPAAVQDAPAAVLGAPAAVPGAPAAASGAPALPAPSAKT